MLDPFLSLFPAAFPALALAHFLALVSPGPDFFLIVGHGVRHRFPGSAYICLGIALGNAVYIGLAIIGWAGLKQHPLLYRGLELAGGAYLLWMGLMLWKAARRPVSLKTRAAPALSPAAQLAAGLASALLNPKNMVFYLTLMTVILGAETRLEEQITAGVWMTLVVLAWDLMLAAGLSRPAAQHRLERRIPLIERAAGVLLIGLSAVIVFGPLMKTILA